MTGVNFESDVLIKNLAKYLLAIGIEIGENSPLNLFNSSAENIDNFPDLGIYDGYYEDLLERFSIRLTSPSDFKFFLEETASIYLKIYPVRSVSLFYKDHMEKIKRLAKYASLLQYEINNTNLDFYEFIDLTNYFVEEKNEPTSHEFMNSVSESLQVLENLEDRVKKSEFGKRLKIGEPSAKKDQALKAWVSLHYEVWTKELGRTMKRDKTGIGGRKRFLEYLDYLMAPLNPEMCSHNIDLSEVRENPITNETIDSVLKGIQKEIKLRGKND